MRTKKLTLGSVNHPTPASTLFIVIDWTRPEDADSLPVTLGGNAEPPSIKQESGRIQSYTVQVIDQPVIIPWNLPNGLWIGKQKLLLTLKSVSALEAIITVKMYLFKKIV